MLKTSTNWDQEGQVVLQTADCSSQDSCNIYSTRTNAEDCTTWQVQSICANGNLPEKYACKRGILFAFQSTMQKRQEELQ